MRILLCNKYFFLNGGTERYLSRCLEALPERGHEAIPFSVNYDGSWPSPYSPYFLTPPGETTETHFDRIRLTPRNAWSFAGRSIYSIEARKKLELLLRDLGGADVGYVLNVYNYMSPSIVHSFRKLGIPVVVRFGDYHPLCASYNLLRDYKPCTLCAKGAYFHGVRYKCVKGSLAASALRVLSMYVQKLLKLYRGCDGFVAPCDFMRNKLVEGGFPEDRVHVIRQPAPKPVARPDVIKGNYVLYFGRISPEKGLDTLIRAYQALNSPQDLLIVGRSYDGHAEYLTSLVAPEFKQRIQFPGFMDGGQLEEVVERALLTIVPSRWYDNAPLATYESYMLGTPVLAADIGGIPEQVRVGETGELFAPEDEADLSRKLKRLLGDREMLTQMGREARRYAIEKLGLDRHLDQLIALFESVVRTK
jgi:glycosyltransferase involved in cell wall biosynthesis